MDQEQVSIMYMPTPTQREMWWGLVMEADGVDQDGYWLGWCPVHDSVRDVELASAQFNFRKGVMRCLREPPCHEGKRVISLTNLTIMIMKGGEHGER